MMSNKNNLSRGAKARALALVPVLGLTLLALNCAPVVNALSKLSNAESISELVNLKNDGKITDFSAENQIISAEETDNLAVETIDMTDPVQNEAAPAVNDDKKVFNSVKQMPQFPGGERALLNYVIQNIKYPQSETDNPKAVNVVVRFVVGADGKVEDVSILRGKSEAFNEEAIRVVKTLPDFIPGKDDNGNNVAVWYTLPIIFKSTSSQSKAETETETAPTVLATEKSDSKVISDSDRPGVYRSVEKMPQFPGGEKALLEYIAANIKYPEAEAKEKRQGRVVVSFIVEADGSIGETKILRSRSEGFDAEAIRVVKSLPNFIPGQSGGKNVAVWYNLPIIFKLMEDQPKAE